MNLSDIESRLVPWYVSSATPGGGSIHLESQPGIGKTSVITLLPSKLEAAFPGKKYGMSLINGATLTMTGATGYLMPEEYEGRKLSSFTIPPWWFTMEGKPLDYYDGGCVFVDEVDKINLDEKKILGEGALSKVIGTHKLPPGWVVWFAGNRAKDRSGSTRDFDHLISRRCTIEVSTDILSLLKWMSKNNVLPETRLFAEDNSLIVFEDPPKQQAPWCSPRSLHQADIHLQALMKCIGTDIIPTDPLTQEEIAGRIGEGAARQYLTSIMLGQELPKFEYIVANPMGVPIPRRPDAMRLSIYKLVSRVDAASMEPVLQYIGRMGDEFQVMFGRQVVMRDPRFVTNKDFGAWTTKSKQLINLMASLRG